MPRYIIVGPAATGKTTLANQLALADPSLKVYDDPSSPPSDTDGSWVYVCQCARLLPAAIRRAAVVLKYVPSEPPFTFREAKE